MNVRQSTVTKTLVIPIAPALGVLVKLLRVLASTPSMLLVFQKQSLFVMLNKKRRISIRSFSVVSKRLNQNSMISILLHKINITKPKMDLKKAIRITIRKTTRNVPTREDAMLNGLLQQFYPSLSSLTFSTLFLFAVLSNNLNK